MIQRLTICSQLHDGETEACCRTLDAMWIPRTLRLRTSASETSSVKSVAQVRLETPSSRIQRRKFKRSAPTVLICSELSTLIRQPKAP